MSDSAAGSGSARPAGVDVVVVAAGGSRRMAGVDKLAATVAGRPLLAWTLAALDAAAVDRIVIVAPESRRADIAGATWLPARVVAVVAGGTRRQESVHAGVVALAGEPGGADGDRVILVHDGARPLVSPALLAEVAGAAAELGAVIPVVPIAETVKRVEADRVSGTVDRAGLALAQTPQGFRRKLLEEAYRHQPPAAAPTWTDEAALLEACKIAVHAIPGDADNLKVTVPDDLRRVEAALLRRASQRVGIGDDRHPFGPGEPLALGGIVFAGAPRLHGHSDGDVVLHAVADALLGAAGLGDLGRLFPADARTPRGVSSRDLLADVVARVAAAGLRPVGLDVTIVAARPRLGRRLDEMRDEIAGLLGVPARAVGVKAATGNLDGMEGAGRGISARAAAVLEAAS